jgi:serine/threonine protein kinase
MSGAELSSEPSNSRYSDGDEIGRGAMGSITQATDRTLNRSVAMKVLRHQGHEVSETRFAREAMVLRSGSRHPSAKSSLQTLTDGRDRETGFVPCRPAVTGLLCP